MSTEQMERWTGDAVVIGGGIVGCAAAYELAAAGLRVVLVERGPANREGSGTTAGNLHIQAIHRRRPGQLLEADSRRFLPLQKAASEMWNTIEAELGTSVELRRNGGFMVAETEAEANELREKYELEASLGVASQLISGDDARRESSVLGPTVLLADYCPEDGYANPLLVTPAYLAAAKRFGARVDAFSEVVGIQLVKGGYEVRCSTGICRAPIVINTTGPWLSQVARLAGICLDLAPVAIQMHATVRTEPFLRHLIQHIGEGLSVKQVTAGNVLIGGGWPAARLDLDGRSTVSLSSMAGNLRLAGRVIPALRSLRILRVWAGPLAATPDEMPVIGEVPGFKGFFIAGGTYAFTLAPLWAKVLRTLILGEALPVDISGLEPARLMLRSADTIRTLE